MGDDTKYPGRSYGLNSSGEPQSPKERPTSIESGRRDRVNSRNATFTAAELKQIKGNLRPTSSVHSTNPIQEYGITDEQWQIVQKTIVKEQTNRNVLNLCRFILNKGNAEYIDHSKDANTTSLNIPLDVTQHKKLHDAISELLSNPDITPYYKTAILTLVKYRTEDTINQWVENNCHGNEELKRTIKTLYQEIHQKRQPTDHPVIVEEQDSRQIMYKQAYEATKGNPEESNSDITEEMPEGGNSNITKEKSEKSNSDINEEISKESQSDNVIFDRENNTPSYEEGSEFPTPSDTEGAELFDIAPPPPNTDQPDDADQTSERYNNTQNYQETNNNNISNSKTPNNTTESEDGETSIAQSSTLNSIDNDDDQSTEDNTTTKDNDGNDESNQSNRDNNTEIIDDDNDDNDQSTEDNTEIEEDDLGLKSLFTEKKEQKFDSWSSIASTTVPETTPSNTNTPPENNQGNNTAQTTENNPEEAEENKQKEAEESTIEKTKKSELEKAEEQEEQIEENYSILINKNEDGAIIIAPTESVSELKKQLGSNGTPALNDSSHTSSSHNNTRVVDNEKDDTVQQSDEKPIQSLEKKYTTNAEQRTARRKITFNDVEEVSCSQEGRKQFVEKVSSTQETPGHTLLLFPATTETLEPQFFLYRVGRGENLLINTNEWNADDIFYVEEALKILKNNPNLSTDKYKAAFNLVEKKLKEEKSRILEQETNNTLHDGVAITGSNKVISQEQETTPATEETTPATEETTPATEETTPATEETTPATEETIPATEETTPATEETTPATEETTPATEETTPATEETTPATEETTPATEETTPATEETTPATEETTPATEETTPATEETTPATEETTPATEETTPATEETTPATEETTPATEETTPATEETTPATEETTPATEETTPATEETTPATEETTPATEETTPATEETTPATEETTPATEETTPAIEENTPAIDETTPATEGLNNQQTTQENDQDIMDQVISELGSQTINLDKESSKIEEIVPDTQNIIQDIKQKNNIQLVDTEDNSQNPNEQNDTADMQSAIDVLKESAFTSATEENYMETENHNDKSVTNDDIKLQELDHRDNTSAPDVTPNNTPVEKQKGEDDSPLIS